LIKEFILPRYNRRKSRFNWERAIQGAVSGAATGGSVAGPEGAVVGAFTGGVTGGLTGRDTSIDRAPYDRAIGEFSQLRRRRARVAADEHSAQSGAAFQRRGLNTSELAGGVISANRGRFMRDAETDIATFAADINLRIAEAEQKAEMADDELTRQGWLDLAGQLGLMAISGEFTDKKLSEGMLASLKTSHPDEVDKWLSGTLSDEDLVGIYTRYGKLHGEPGTMQRRFTDLERNVYSGKELPKANLPSSESESTRTSTSKPSPSYEQSRRESVPTSPDGTQGEPVNIEGKPIVPIEPGDSEVVRMVKRVIPKEDFEVLEAIEPDLKSLLTGDTPESKFNQWLYRDKTDMSAESTAEPTETDAEYWNRLKAEMEAILNDPEATPYVKSEAYKQLELIESELYRVMTGGIKTEQNTQRNSRRRSRFNMEAR